ncbi:MAG: hypothetical protein ACLGSD_10990 [Acidobacteriota bacterium]
MGESATTADWLPCSVQQAPLMSAPCMGQSGAIALQQACRSIEWLLSRQAALGNADHNTAITKSNIAPFLPSRMID